MQNYRQCCECQKVDYELFTFLFLQIPEICSWHKQKLIKKTKLIYFYLKVLYKQHEEKLIVRLGELEHKFTVLRALNSFNTFLMVDWSE